MRTHPTAFARRCLLSPPAVLSALLALTLAAPLTAAAAQPSGADAIYRTELHRCAGMAEVPKRASCRYEALASLRDAKAGRTLTPDAATLERNRQARCERVPEGQRAVCLRMANGDGSSSGTVEEGAILRELVTVEPAGG